MTVRGLKKIILIISLAHSQYAEMGINDVQVPLVLLVEFGAIRRELYTCFRLSPTSQTLPHLLPTDSEYLFTYPEQLVSRLA